MPKPTPPSGPIQPSSAVSPSMTMFTFDELIDEIDVATGRATEKQSWTTLRNVANELAGRPRSDTEAKLVQSRNWQLIEIEILNFQGVGGNIPLQLTFDPRPGITVIHGPNGSGKSSISAALEAALTGCIPTPTETRGGNRPIWEPIPLTRGATSTYVSVTLQDGDASLYLRIDVSPDNTLTWTCELESDGSRQNVLIDSAWADAIANHKPVFAYAALERRVQLSRDLAEYFENLLALGGAFTSLADEVKRQSEDAQKSHCTWKDSLHAFQAASQEIDGNYAADTVSDLAAVTTPSVADDIDDWAGVNQLLETGDLGPSLTLSEWYEIQASAAEVVTAINDLDEIRSDRLGALLPALKALCAATSNSSDDYDDTPCPVCGGSGRSWHAALVNTVEQLDHANSLYARASEKARQLNTQVASLLATPLGSLDSHSSSQFRKRAKRGTELCEELADAVANHGTQSHHEVLDAAVSLATWIRRDSTDKVIKYAIMQGDRVRNWRVARAAAAAPFVATWRTVQDSASTASSWTATLKRVDDLRTRLRKRRTTTLEQRSDMNVNRLLADVGVAVAGLTVQKTKAELRLEDVKGDELELGMLSAGQRNAMLLAPLLASVDGGPFNFVLLDDPVHAFDQIRVDRLAQTLSELARDRRVIVMTHDERLREHSMAHARNFDSRAIERDPSAETVSVVQADSFWIQLLDDAKSALDLGAPVARTSMSLTDIVRGLCRQAVDNALRDAAVAHAVAERVDPGKVLVRLDRKNTTRDRLNEFRKILTSSSQTPSPVDGALSHCGEHLTNWNRSSHGNPALSIVSEAEIDAARRACGALLGIPNVGK